MTRAPTDFLRRPSLLVVSIIALAVTAPFARAAAAPVTASASAAEKEAAKEHFAIAHRLFAEQKFAAAAVEYEAAHRAWALDGFYFNIAQCHRNLGHTDAAIDYFQRYLESPTVKNRAEVEPVLAELREKRAAGVTATVASTPPAAAEKAKTPGDEVEKVVPVAFAAIVPAAIAPVATPKDAPPTSGKDAPAGTPSPSLVAVVETKSADSANSNALRVESTPPTAATQPPPQLLPLPEPMSEGEPQPVYRRAWFWAAAVGALVLVGGGVAVGALASTHVPSGSLGMADWR